MSFVRGKMNFWLMSISCQFEGKIEVFFGSLERNHAKLEAHQKNSKLFLTFFNQILVSIAALNHYVGEMWLLTGLQNVGGEYGWYNPLTLPPEEFKARHCARVVYLGTNKISVLWDQGLSSKAQVLVQKQIWHKFSWNWVWEEWSSQPCLQPLLGYL